MSYLIQFSLNEQKYCCNGHLCLVMTAERILLHINEKKCTNAVSFLDAFNQAFSFFPPKRRLLSFSATEHAPPKSWGGEMGHCTACFKSEEDVQGSRRISHLHIWQPKHKTSTLGKPNNALLGEPAGKLSKDCNAEPEPQLMRPAFLNLGDMRLHLHKSTCTEVHRQTNAQRRRPSSLNNT